MSALARLLGTFFFIGYVPKGPGTAGSLGALAVAWWLHTYEGIPAAGFAVYALLLLAPASWAAGRVAEDIGKKDPQIVVIDEVVGQWITLAGAVTLNWKSWLAAFALFRVFDIWKPPPVRQLERIQGGAGIVMDDVMAGIYAALVLYGAGWFNLY
ncbi:MAG: phosphatidylglycerophosphatase [Bryobacterales bacterium]|nr:phosphatidylglycerophosphatase [Bryobacterales bacterium]